MSKSHLASLCLEPSASSRAESANFKFNRIAPIMEDLSSGEQGIQTWGLLEIASAKR